MRPSLPWSSPIILTPAFADNALLGLSRASYYYAAAPEEQLNLELMRRIDVQYLQTPFYGWPKMTVALRSQGYHVNGKRVRRLMRQMGVRPLPCGSDRRRARRGIGSIPTCCGIW